MTTLEQPGDTGPVLDSSTVQRALTYLRRKGAGPEIEQALGLASYEVRRGQRGRTSRGRDPGVLRGRSLSWLNALPVDALDHPERSGLNIQPDALVRPPELLAALGRHGRACTPADVEAAVDLPPALEAVDPPPILYHGTVERAMPEILLHGLDRIRRRHVHLSVDRYTAEAAGARHGPEVLLEVAAKQMVEHGHEFFRAGNEVWLTEHVPIAYLTILADRRQRQR